MVAVTVSSSLILHFRVPAGGGSSSCDRIDKFAFKGAAHGSTSFLERRHGSTSDCRKFDFATIQVKVT